MLAYHITNWAVAPGPREARFVVTDAMRENSRRRARSHVQRICRALHELDTPPTHRAIAEVAKRLGFKRTDELVEEAKAIFAGPGMLVRNGSRRRTLGGIFFQLAKTATLGSAAGAVDRDERHQVGVLLR